MPHPLGHWAIRCDIIYYQLVVVNVEDRVTVLPLQQKLMGSLLYVHSMRGQTQQSKPSNSKTIRTFQLHKWKVNNSVVKLHINILKMLKCITTFSSLPNWRNCSTVYLHQLSLSWQCWASMAKRHCVTMAMQRSAGSTRPLVKWTSWPLNQRDVYERSHTTWDWHTL